MSKAQYLTSWIGNGSLASPYQPAVANVPGIESVRDVTGQQAILKVPGPGVHLITDPNMYIVEVEASDRVLDAIVAAGHEELWRG